MWKIWRSGAVAAAAAASGGGIGRRNMMDYYCYNYVSVRHISRNREPRNLSKINPKLPYQEATSIAERLYNLIRLNGPLTLSNTWIHSQEAGISELKSKTHMKLMLKWMRGRNMLKLFCNQVGSSKKFLHCTLPEDPQTEQARKLMELHLHSALSPKRNKKKLQQQQQQHIS